MNCKVVGALLVFTGLAYAIPANIIQSFDQNLLDQHAIANTIFQDILLPKVLEQLKHSLPEIRGNSLKLEDPTPLPAFNLSLDHDPNICPGQRFFGYFTAQDVLVHGLSELDTDFTQAYYPIASALRITFRASSPTKLRISGNYELKHRTEIVVGFHGVECRTMAVLPSSGRGGWFFEVDAPLVDVAITVGLESNAKVISYRGNLNLTSVSMNFDDFLLYDYYKLGPENWANASHYLEGLVERAHQDRPYVDAWYKRALDRIINGCYFMDFYTGNWECLKFEWD